MIISPLLHCSFTNIFKESQDYEKYVLILVFFLLKAKYTGREKSRDLQEGLTHMDKTLCVKGARIAYTMWEVPGNILFDILFVVSFILESEIQMIYDAGNDNQKQLPIACADSVAILFMFDLTSRCTLNR